MSMLLYVEQSLETAFNYWSYIVEQSSSINPRIYVQSEIFLSLSNIWYAETGVLIVEYVLVH